MELPPSLIEKNIRRGAILQSYTFEEIGHGKFFVIIGTTADYVAGLFFINSNINKSLYGKQAQLDMQYPLKRADYDFLCYDSFLCATNIIKRPKNYITQSIQLGKSKFVGDLKENHLNDVLTMVRKSRLFSKAEKDTFFY